jgi:hypothetical protein
MAKMCSRRYTNFQLFGYHVDLPIAIEKNETISTFILIEVTCVISVKDHIEIMIISIRRPSPSALDHFFILLKSWPTV